MTSPVGFGGDGYVDFGKEIYRISQKCEALTEANQNLNLQLETKNAEIQSLKDEIANLSQRCHQLEGDMVATHEHCQELVSLLEMVHTQMAALEAKRHPCLTFKKALGRFLVRLGRW